MRKRDKYPDALGKYEEKWVAVNRDKTEIIAASGSLKTALAEAKSQGEERPIMMMVPAKCGGYVL